MRNHSQPPASARPRPWGSHHGRGASRRECLVQCQWPRARGGSESQWAAAENQEPGTGPAFPPGNRQCLIRHGRPRWQHERGHLPTERGHSQATGRQPQAQAATACRSDWLEVTGRALGCVALGADLRAAAAGAGPFFVPGDVRESRPLPSAGVPGPLALSLRLAVAVTVPPRGSTSRRSVALRGGVTVHTPSALASVTPRP